MQLGQFIDISFYFPDVVAPVVTEIAVINHHAAGRRRVLLVEQQLDSLLIAALVRSANLSCELGRFLLEFRFPL